MSVLVAQQPNYFPWLGYLEQWAAADHFVFLDDVQWIRQGRQHRTLLAPHESQAEERSQWLTLPVFGHGHRESSLGELALADAKWSENHWRTIQAVYGSAPFFRSQLANWLPKWFASMSKMDSAAAVAAASVRALAHQLELKNTSFSFSSQQILPVDRTERLVELCLREGASIYYCAMGSSRYLDFPQFRASGTTVIQQNFRLPDYRAPDRPEGLPLLSALDALAYIPIEEIRQWLLPKSWGPFAHRLDVGNNFKNSL